MRIGDYVRAEVNDYERNTIIITKLNHFAYNNLISVEDSELLLGNESIIKSSPNIIDLIEENDYIRIITDTDFRRVYSSYGKLVIYRGKELPIEAFSNKFIGEIITHEQMETIQYRVEENK